MARIVTETTGTIFKIGSMRIIVDKAVSRLLFFSLFPSAQDKGRVCIHAQHTGCSKISVMPGLWGAITCSKIVELPPDSPQGYRSLLVTKMLCSPNATAPIPGWMKIITRTKEPPSEIVAAFRKAGLAVPKIAPQGAIGRAADKALHKLGLL